MYWRNQADLVE